MTSYLGHLGDRISDMTMTEKGVFMRTIVSKIYDDAGCPQDCYLRRMINEDPT